MVVTANWRRIALFSASLGAGFAVVAAAAFIIVHWYQSQPKPPVPWNSRAITARFSHLSTEGEKPTLVFWYILENTTDYDYTLSNLDSASFMVTLTGQQALVPAEFQGLNLLTCDIPVFVPAHRSIRSAIHMKLPYTGAKLPDEKSARLETWLRQRLPTLGGFELYDRAQRYEIRFPTGWQ